VPLTNAVVSTIGDVVARMRLDLSGLVVFTEAASGPYLGVPLLAAAAGARRVHAVAADNRWHRADDVIAETRAAAEALGLEGLVLARTKEPAALGEADIVTNTGAVRPIDAATVAQLKPTAVVPLMWEAWELRPDEVDVAACRRAGVLVLGTDECTEWFDMRPYMADLGLKLLGELGVEPSGSSVLVLGRQPLIGGAIEAGLRAAGATVTWVDGGGPYPSERYDAVIVAEHVLRDPLPLEPTAPVGVVAGNVDAEALRAAGVRVVPDVIAPPGTMSYQPAVLGPRPVLELTGAGLKVGEVAARARLAGLDVAAATAVALRDSPAQAVPP
jgi:hypothetical protein